MGIASFLPRGLSAEVERLDDGAVALDVTSFRYSSNARRLPTRRSSARWVPKFVFVALEVFCKVADTVRKQRDLALGRTRVGVRLAVLAEKLLLFLCC